MLSASFLGPKLNICFALIMCCGCLGGPIHGTNQFVSGGGGCIAPLLQMAIFCISVGTGARAAENVPSVIVPQAVNSQWSLQDAFRVDFLFSQFSGVGDAFLHVCLLDRTCAWARPGGANPLLGRRLGEADHPGPGSFRISVINPTGLNNKFDLIATPPPGIYAVSESHLAEIGLQRFRAAMHRNTSFSYVAGAPVPLRARSQVSGMYSGVGFLSSFPTRTVAQDWDPVLYQTGRIAACSFFIQPFWVLGVTMYGYATGKERTADLVREAFDRVLAQPAGPRFVSGDFNLCLEEIPHLDALRQHGFRELQEVVRIKFGRVPTPTCKQSTQKDFLFLSPELESALLGAEVALDYFPDHGVLTGFFQLNQADCASFTWKVPKHRPRLKHGRLDLAGQSVHLEGTPSERYGALWDVYEQRLSAALLQRGAVHLLPHERGRAATKDVAVKKAQVVPPPHGRQGELHPSFQGLSLKHAHWFRQLRRLQALKQALQKGSRSHTAVEHRASLWHSIVCAPGFAQDFASWYRTRPISLPDDLEGVLGELPGLPEVSRLLLTFHANVEHLEKCLANLRKRDARHKRSQNPFLIFKDMRAEGPKPVETLLEGPVAQVVEHHPDEAAVVIERPVLFDPELPVTVGNRPCGIVHVDDCKLWLDSAESIAPGALVRQDKLLGSAPDLFRAFGDEWSKRWSKHCGVEVERWRAAVDTARLFHAAPEASFDAITPALWRAEVQRKKGTSAPGLDGISKQDLALMPDDLLQLLLDVYTHAESTGAWPDQAMQAVISALEKRPNASRVGDYRPITIISLVYRIWSGIRSRQCLRHLMQFCGTHQHGCLPGRSATNVWFDTQASIELARRAGVHRTGVISDIIKAFNCIPREPVFALAIALGLPVNIVRAWQGALTRLQRRFKIRGSVSPGLGSTTGFPEGDGLSCTAVAILGISFHRFMLHKAPDVRAITYVDNLAGVSDSCSAVISAWGAFQEWAQAWDLQLDKTVAWSTCPVGRRNLRLAGFQVVLDGPDLGGHMQYALRRTNFGLVGRITSFELAWLRLGQSLAPYRQKVLAIRAAAWPATLHACSLVHLGGRHFDTLRTHAAKALNSSGPGVNAKLLLSFVETPLSDPEYFALWSSLRDVARYAVPNVAVACLNAAALAPGRPVPGPFGVLLVRLQAIGVHWIPDEALFSDGFGTWGLWSISSQELQFRIEVAWQAAVAANLQHRPGFSGLRDVDAGFTRHVLGERGPEAQALLRVPLSGRFFTEKELHHIGSSEGNACPFCGRADSITHRVQWCPYFAQERSLCLHTSGIKLSSLPAVQREHAWALKPQGWRDLQLELTSVPWPDEVPPLNLQLCGQQHLFVDGSCLLPTKRWLRIASWAVVLAARTTQSAPSVLHAGPLPTLVQNSFRAEIFAFLIALMVVEASDGEFCIWSDCSGVVARVGKFLLGAAQPSPLSSNSDLWLPLWQIAQHVRGRVRVFKVPAHEDATLAQDSVLEWAILQNSAVDAAARTANLNRSDVFWNKWEVVRRSMIKEECTAEAIISLHAAIGRKATQTRVRHGGRTRDGQQAPPDQAVVAEGVGHFPVQYLVDRLGSDYIGRLQDWVSNSFLRDSVESRPVWVSNVELFLGFVLETSYVPPVYVARRKQWVRNPHISASFSNRVRWFFRNLTALLKAGGVQIATAQKWPASSALGGIHTCLPVVLPERQRLAIESFLDMRIRSCPPHGNNRWRSLTLPDSCFR